MLHGVASLAAVLLAAVLLGLEVWVAGIGALGYVVTRPALAPRVIANALLALAASAAAYVTIVILIVVCLSS
jgi:hypothetical protein